jgi:hypothetical protein
MRKRSFFTGFVFVIFTGLFLAGCVSAYYVFDKSIPAENLSVLKLPLELSVVKFDDTDVKWQNGFGYYTDGSQIASSVKIPAGEHTLIVNYYIQKRNGQFTETITAKGIEVKYDFQPGITYKLSTHMVGYNKIAVIVEKY